MATIKIKFRASSVSGKEGTLFLQVIHRRVARQLSTWYKVFPEEWDAARQTVAFPEDVSPYRSRYLREEQAGDFLAFATLLAGRKREEGRMSLAANYRATPNSFRQFLEDRPLSFEGMDTSLMLGYEHYLKKQGLCPNTTSFYMRNLRAIYNQAVEQGLAVLPGQCLLRPHWRQGRANVRVGGSDFCENQTEINTPIFKSAEEVVADLDRHTRRIEERLAAGLTTYGWTMVALTAASPLLDGSYFEPGRAGEDVFCGMASVRCSEMGYWNGFTPVLDYTDTPRYAATIRRYVDEGLLAAPSELYYPIRLKPRGANSLDTLLRHGVNHIELRMIDLHPLLHAGIDLRDVKFAQLLIAWVAAQPRHWPTTGRSLTRR